MTTIFQFDYKLGEHNLKLNLVDSFRACICNILEKLYNGIIEKQKTYRLARSSGYFWSNVQVTNARPLKTLVLDACATVSMPASS